jgi:16S rRNA (uracil1498-N3)-methyltransferase
MTRSTGNTACHQTAPRLFVDTALREGATIETSAEQTHYLGTVLRRGSGDVVRLFNGADGEWAARLRFARGDRSSRASSHGIPRGASLTAENQLRPQQPEAGPWLVFALLKRDATDLVVRQAVELGASRLLPVVTERTNAARVNGERLRAIAVEAAEQSERLTIPIIDAPARLEAILTAWPPNRQLFAALERSPLERSVADAKEAGAQKTGQAALLVGPEGGLTPAERELLHRLDFVTPISLGPFVLRAETAAAAGQALLLGMGWAGYVPST